MKEPSAANFPNGKYDDKTSLFGTIKNTKILTVAYEIGVDASIIEFTESQSYGATLQTPFYLIFYSGEIWYVHDGGFTWNGTHWQVSLDATADQRAMHGSPLQPHMENEKVYVGMVSSHVNQMKRAVMAAQKYHFLIFDTEAAMNTYKAGNTINVGERFLCKDTKKIYYCFATNTLTWINRAKHADLDNLGVNTHTQYYLKSSADAYHTSLGEHIEGGDDHDHTSTNQGNPIQKIRAGTTLPARPYYRGEVYFDTDDNGGTLYISPDAVTWEKVGGVPSGAILPFNQACPTGWTRFTALDSRYPYGAASAGAVGGGNTHTHAYTDIAQHYHTIDSKTVALKSGGGHYHPIDFKSGSGSTYAAFAPAGGGGTWDTDDDGSHTHTCTVEARTTDTTGVSSPVTLSGNTEPLYAEAVFCKKD